MSRITEASEYITASEVMKTFALSKNTVYRLLNAGKIRSVRLGPRSIRIHRADVQRWLESSVHKPVVAEPSRSIRRSRAKRKTAKKGS